MGEFEFSKVSESLHEGRVFDHLEDAPWYKDAVYPRFSEKEYERRRAITRAEMKERGLDCIIAGGGSNLMSMWGPLVWLTGHMDFRSVANYVVFPAEGEPTLLYPMSGTHIWAVRRQAAGVSDVRAVRESGGYGKSAAARIMKLGYGAGAIGITSVNMEGWGPEYMPANYIEDLRGALPEADLVFLPDFFHKLWYIKSDEELDFYRKAGELADRSLEALVERARPGVTERQLAASANFAVAGGGGYPHFCIVGATSMARPSQIFGNPNPSDRSLARGDIVNNEMAAGYGGVTVQIGNPVCIGKPTDAAQRLWDEAVLPSAEAIEKVLVPGKTLEDVRQAGRVVLERGCAGRPTLCRGIDIATSSPHIRMEEVHGADYEQTLQPGMVIMSEPNPATKDGLLGMFFGRTYIITEDGNEAVTKYPFVLPVVD